VGLGVVLVLGVVLGFGSENDVYVYKCISCNNMMENSGRVWVRTVVVMLIIMVLLMFAGCGEQNEEKVKNESNMSVVPIMGNFSSDVINVTQMEFKEGYLNYNFIINKQSPCYGISKDEYVMESYPVQIIINLQYQFPSNDIECPQIITPEMVNGSMYLGDTPGSVAVKLDGSVIYHKFFS